MKTSFWVAILTTRLVWADDLLSLLRKDAIYALSKSYGAHVVPADLTQDEPSLIRRAVPKQKTLQTSSQSQAVGSVFDPKSKLEEIQRKDAKSKAETLNKSGRQSVDSRGTDPSTKTQPKQAQAAVGSTQERSRTTQLRSGVKGSANSDSGKSKAGTRNGPMAQSSVSNLSGTAPKAGSEKSRGSMSRGMGVKRSSGEQQRTKGGSSNGLTNPRTGARKSGAAASLLANGQGTSRGLQTGKKSTTTRLTEQTARPGSHGAKNSALIKGGLDRSSRMKGPGATSGAVNMKVKSQKLSLSTRQRGMLRDGSSSVNSKDMARGMAKDAGAQSHSVSGGKRKRISESETSGKKRFCKRMNNGGGGGNPECDPLINPPAAPPPLPNQGNNALPAVVPPVQPPNWNPLQHPNPGAAPAFQEMTRKHKAQEQREQRTQDGMSNTLDLMNTGVASTGSSAAMVGFCCKGTAVVCAGFTCPTIAAGTLGAGAIGLALGAGAVNCAKRKHDKRCRQNAALRAEEVAAFHEMHAEQVGNAVNNVGGAINNIGGAVNNIGGVVQNLGGQVNNLQAQINDGGANGNGNGGGGGGGGQ